MVKVDDEAKECRETGGRTPSGDDGEQASDSAEYMTFSAEMSLWSCRAVKYSDAWPTRAPRGA